MSIEKTGQKLVNILMHLGYKTIVPAKAHDIKTTENYDLSILSDTINNLLEILPSQIVLKGCTMQNIPKQKINVETYYENMLVNILEDLSSMTFYLNKISQIIYSQQNQIDYPLQLYKNLRRLTQCINTTFISLQKEQFYSQTMKKMSISTQISNNFQQIYKYGISSNTTRIQKINTSLTDKFFDLANQISSPFYLNLTLNTKKSFEFDQESLFSDTQTTKRFIPQKNSITQDEIEGDLIFKLRKSIEILRQNSQVNNREYIQKMKSYQQQLKNLNNQIYSCKEQLDEQMQYICKLQKQYKVLSQQKNYNINLIEILKQQLHIYQKLQDNTNRGRSLSMKVKTQTSQAKQACKPKLHYQKHIIYPINEKKFNRKRQ